MKVYLNLYSRANLFLAALCSMMFILIVPVRAQTVSANHGELNYLLGAPSYEVSTGWVGSKIAGFGAYIKVGGGIGGTLEQITMNGKGVLTQVADTTWSLSFQGTANGGAANTNIGLSAGAEYKLVTPDKDVYTGDIYSWGLAFKDNKTFTPYLFKSSVTLTSTLPDLPAVYRSFYVPGTNKKISVEAGVTLGTSLENKISGDYISTSAGNITPDQPSRNIGVTSTPFTINNISEHLKSNVTIFLTPKANIGFSVWFLSYSVTIPIVKIPSKMPEVKYSTSSTSMTFNMPSAQLSVAKTGNGNGSLQVNGVTKSFPFGPQTYTYGTKVTLKVVPSGSSFNGWTGAYLGGGQKQNPMVLTIGGNKSLNADLTTTVPARDSVSFEIINALAANIKVNGVVRTFDVSTKNYSEIFKAGDRIGIEAIMNDDRIEFHSWQWYPAIGASVVIKDNPWIFTADPKTVGYERIRLGYQWKLYNLKITKSGNGSGKLYFFSGSTIKPVAMPIDTTFVINSIVKIQAVPDGGSVFTGWSGDLDGVVQTRSFTLSRNLALNVDFHVDVRYNVWFQVNMGPYMRLGWFNPSTDSIVVRGDFQHFLGSTDWVGNNYLLKKAFNNDSLYYLSIPFPDTAAGNTINYLFYRIRNGDELAENSVGSRSHTITTNSTQTIPTVYFDNQKSSHVVKVTFKADMSKLISSGFDPENNIIGIRGSNAPLNWNTGAQMHRDTVNTQYYSVTASFALDRGTPVQWKFHTFPDSIFVNTGWETITENRMFVIPAADTTIGPIAPVIQLVNPLSVRQIQTGTLPSDFALGQNYPNPFNPSTTITYAIPKSSFVSLKVYNIRGEQVADLIGRYQQAGMYNVSFDALTLASGVYMYRIQAGGYSSTKKMTLIK